MNEYVLAVDLGGTNLRVAAVDLDGRVLHVSKAATPRSNDADEVVSTIASLSRECVARTGAAALAFGVAVPATLDLSTGRILRAPNLPELDGYLLVDELSRRLGLRVVIENDATAAAIGEHWRGASRPVRDSICITLGTGVGGGIIIGDRPHRGVDGTAGEIGHICVEPLGVPCPCGSNGCLEQYASASAVVRMTKERLEEHPDSPLNSFSALTALDVYNAGIAGDSLARDVFSRVGSYLGIVLAGLINVLNPEMIVIGGGMSSGWQLFVDEVREQIGRRAFERPAARARITRAELGDLAGLVGAAHLAIQAAGRE
ncbi:MAG: ROK family protein [Pyrinomonadaceae bacterium]